jgi:hypothetical protein
MEVTIENVENDCVRIKLTVERHLQNIGAIPRLQRGMITVTDWGFEEPASITKCEISNIEGTRRKSYRHVVPRKQDISIKAETPRMILRSQDTVIVIYEYSSILRRNDHFIEWFLTPTRNPEIRIIGKPEDLDVTAGFGTDAKLKYTHIPHRYELDSVYFPPAVMSVRWFPKSTQTNFPLMS